MALDAVSTPTIVESVPFRGQTTAGVNGYDTDASTAIDFISAPGSGKSLYLQKIILQSDDADAHPQIQDGDGTVLFGPLMSAVEGPSLTLDLGEGAIKVTSNKAVALKAAAAGNVFVFVKYKTAED
ncbi:MAG: hypothetical protein JXA96_17360 [Sedimentisphaerales bacterium]|nr:hypothetical protein [Sedimentisphaerales bacterium]